MLNATTNPFLKEVLDRAAASHASPKDPGTPSEIVKPGRKGPGAAAKKPTLGSIFKASLIQLKETIDSTNAHYIRCIKPNEAKAAWEFDPPLVLSQLKACGVLETIRISCAGYPTRWTFEEFAERLVTVISLSFLHVLTLISSIDTTCSHLRRIGDRICVVFARLSWMLPSKMKTSTRLV